MKKLFNFTIIILFVLLLLSPYLAWLVSDEKELNIVIIDKTVPEDSYREHNGLTWLLNNQKIVKRHSHERYTIEDYYGFFPLQNKEFEIKELPTDLEGIDIIYIADTYGVFHEEYYGENIEGKRSEKIYGGITVDEIETIKDYLYRNNTTLIAEFNSFASPTTKKAREDLTELLSLEWTGWIGRYFVELNPKKTDEVPAWAINNYEDQNKGDWSFDGGGFILINEDDTVVVLENEQHVGKKRINVSFNEKGHSLFNLKESPSYNYWFDIVTAYQDEDIVANYNWDLTSEGQDFLEEYSIPIQLPAVIASNRLGFQSYYFAGDYVDVAEIPSLYKIKGLASLYKWFTDDEVGSTKAFFWKTYVPMLKGIFHIEKQRNDLAIPER